MEAEKQQTWEITVQARSKHFKFKFKSIQIVPTWKFHRLSVLIKIRKFFLRVKADSKSTESVSRKGTLKLKLPRIFKRIRLPRTKNQALTLNNPEAESPLLRLNQSIYKEPILFGILLIGIHLAFLGQWIPGILQKGFNIYSFPALLFFPLLGLLSSKYNRGKFLKLLVILIVAVYTSSAFLNFNNCLTFCGQYVSYILQVYNNVKAGEMGCSCLIYGHSEE